MNIWFWGAGKYLEKIMDVITNQELIAGIIDSLGALHGSKKRGVLIYSPKTVTVNKEDIIIITAFSRYQEIYLETIHYLKVDPDKVLCFFDEKTNYKLWKKYIDIVRWEILYQNILMSRRIDDLERKIVCIKNLRYEIPDTLNKRILYFPRILSGEKALYRIINEHKSMCRFGDGEFEIIAGRKRPDFQLPDEKLGRRLREVLTENNVKVLTCIADNYGSLEAYTDDAADSIREYMTDAVRREHMELLDKDREYYDAYVSRPYIIYKNKSNAEILFQLWKKVWENKDILLVEGCLTRNGYKNDLFNSAKSVNRLLAPPENAWEYYQQIFQYILEKVDKKRIVIISLGPTATVLAYDLALHGYQAIDIGHIDNEYEWYLRKTKERINISYKYVNEITNGRVVDDIDDDEFERQVILRIGC